MPPYHTGFCVTYCNDEVRERPVTPAFFRPRERLSLCSQSLASLLVLQDGWSFMRRVDLERMGTQIEGLKGIEMIAVPGQIVDFAPTGHALATKRNLVKVPKDLPLEMLAPLGCGMQTGAGTVMNSLKVSKGSSIAIFGTVRSGLPRSWLLASSEPTR